MALDKLETKKEVMTEYDDVMTEYNGVMTGCDGRMTEYAMNEYKERDYYKILNILESAYDFVFDSKKESIHNKKYHREIIKELSVVQTLDHAKMFHDVVNLSYEQQKMFMHLYLANFALKSISGLISSFDENSFTGDLESIANAPMGFVKDFSRDVISDFEKSFYSSQTAMPDVVKMYVDDMKLNLNRDEYNN